MKTVTVLAIAILGASLAGPVSAEATRGAMLANTCAGCHGFDGASEGAAPVIGGMSKMYLKQTMLNYKNGVRHSTVMGRLAKGYSDEELDLIAAHYADLPWVNAKQAVDRDLAAKGKELHNKNGCAGCHGQSGLASVPGTPRVAGQYIDYLVQVMEDYKTPTKPIPPTATVMRSVLANMSDEDLEAFAHFYGSQR